MSADNDWLCVRCVHRAHPGEVCQNTAVMDACGCFIPTGMKRGTPMSNSTARKRLHPEPLPHPDPAVCALIEAAREQGRIEGWNAHGEAIHEDARRAAGVDS